MSTLDDKYGLDDTANDFGPQEVIPGEQYASVLTNPALITGANVLKSHLPTITKQLRAGIRAAETMDRGNPLVFGDDLPVGKVTDAMKLRYPQLKDVDYIFINGNNREAYYTKAGSPIIMRLMDLDNRSEKVLDEIVERAVAHSQFDTPAPMNLIEGRDLREKEAREIGNQVGEYAQSHFGVNSGKTLQQGLADHVGLRPFLYDKDKGGRFQEIYYRSGNEGEPIWRPDQELDKALMFPHPDVPQGVPLKEQMGWLAKNDKNGMVRWLASIHEALAKPPSKDLLNTHMLSNKDKAITFQTGKDAENNLLSQTLPGYLDHLYGLHDLPTERFGKPINVLRYSKQPTSGEVLAAEKAKSLVEIRNAREMERRRQLGLE